MLATTTTAKSTITAYKCCLRSIHAGKRTPGMPHAPLPFGSASHSKSALPFPSYMTHLPNGRHVAGWDMRPLLEPPGRKLCQRLFRTIDKLMANAIFRMGIEDLATMARRQYYNGASMAPAFKERSQKGFVWSDGALHDFGNYFYTCVYLEVLHRATYCRRDVEKLLREIQLTWTACQPPRLRPENQLSNNAYGKQGDVIEFVLAYAVPLHADQHPVLLQQRLEIHTLMLKLRSIHRELDQMTYQSELGEEPTLRYRPCAMHFMASIIYAFVVNGSKDVNSPFVRNLTAHIHLYSKLWASPAFPRQ